MVKGTEAVGTRLLVCFVLYALTINKAISCALYAFSPRASRSRSGKVVLVVLVLETLYKTFCLAHIPVQCISSVKSNALQMAHLSTKSHCKK